MVIFVQTYLFDFDGTLVDSMPTYEKSLLRILDENKVSYADDLIKTITPLGIVATAEYCINLGLDLSKEEFIGLMEKYMLEAYFYHIPAKENVIDVLRKLKRRGADLNILTASPHITLDACLKRLGIYDLFTNVWSCDDFDTTKTDPQIYLKIAQKLGKQPYDILFLDDNFHADKTAKQAGMKVCGVYDDSSKDVIDDIKQITDCYIYNFSQLLDLEI